MKKKSSKIIIASMIAAGVLFAGSITAFATQAVTAVKGGDPTVTLVSKGKDNVEFTINRTDNDLFDNFKNVMPGDKLTQKVTVKSDADGINGGSTFNIFLCARNGKKWNKEESKPVPEDLFDKMKITVKDGDKILDLEIKGEDQRGILLGQFKKNDSKDLTVTLEVPKELGNEYQSSAGEIIWCFSAEQIADTPVKTDTPVTALPKTGVNDRMFVYASLAVISLIALVALNVSRKKLSK